MSSKSVTPGKTRTPTLQSVARAARVSTSTASRALRQNPKVALATRERINAMARQIGYRANPYLSVLMTHLRHARPAPYTATLAWLDRSPRPDAWRRNHVQTKFFSGAVERATALGFTVDRVACAEPGLTRPRLTQILRARGIHGALCSAEQPDARLLEFPIDVNSFACATVGCRFTSPALHFSTNDQFVTAQTGHRCLIELGYRRVGLITTLRLEDIVDHRLCGGYLSVVARPNERPGAPIFFHDERDGAALATWLTRYKPDAVLTTFVHEAASTLAQIRAAGLRVPEDIGFAVLDWHEGLRGVAGVNQGHERVGAGAVDLLVSQICRNEFGVPLHPQGVLVEGEWIDGDTAPRRS